MQVRSHHQPWLLFVGKFVSGLLCLVNSEGGSMVVSSHGGLMTNDAAADTDTGGAGGGGAGHTELCFAH